MNVRKVNYKQKDAPYEFTRSLKQTGFSILTNHPIKKDLIDNVYVEWKNFFNWSHIGGLDNMLYTPNGVLHRLLTSLAFKSLTP